MRKALRVLVDGTVEELDLDSAEGSLSVLQNGVKFDENDVAPLVQPIDISKNVIMWCHEEGKILRQPYNVIATAIYDRTFEYGRDYIAGNIVFTGGVDDEGETLGLTEELVERLRLMANTAWEADNK